MPDPFPLHLECQHIWLYSGEKIWCGKCGQPKGSPGLPLQTLPPATTPEQADSIRAFVLRRLKRLDLLGQEMCEDETP